MLCTHRLARNAGVMLSVPYLLCVLQKRLEQESQILHHAKMPAKVGHDGAWMQREHFHACLLSPAHTRETHSRTPAMLWCWWAVQQCVWGIIVCSSRLACMTFARELMPLQFTDSVPWLNHIYSTYDAVLQLSWPESCTPLLIPSVVGLLLVCKWSIKKCSSQKHAKHWHE